MASPRTRIRPVIAGERGFLRRPREADRRQWCSLRRRSGRFLARWEPKKTIAIGSPREFDGLIKRNNRYTRLLCCRNDDGLIVGQISIMMIERGPFQNGTLGYWIGKPYARKGWGAEMLGLAIDHAFGTMELERLEANIIPSNAASRALARSLGLRNEGYSKNYLEIDGKRRDHERWAILASEWSGR